MLERPSETLISRREYFVLIAAIIAALTILFNNDARQIDAIRSAMIDAYGALQARFNWPTRLAPDAEEVIELRRRATQLMLENSQLREALLENYRLRSLLDYRARANLEFRSARVIFKEQGTTPNAVLINLGAVEGMQNNLAVVTPEGVVGKLFRVNRHTSYVQLLLDRNFSVSARVQRSRVLGFVTWSGTQGLEMTGVPRNADVVAGDVVVTSDSSALFPPGIRIGKVEETSMDSASLFLTISLAPEVNFSRLEEVFVVMPSGKRSEGEFLQNSSDGD